MAGLDGEQRRRFEKEVARQRKAGIPLREQLLWRIEELTNGQSVDLAAHIEDFSEVKEAFSIPNTELELIEERSEASLEDGGALKLVGFLYVDSGDRTHLVAQFHRELRLDQECVEHKWLKVEPPFRGYGISSALLLRSFDFYKALGLKGVELDASMETGRWHWARVGFEFMWPRDLERVREWALEVTAQLDVHRPGIEAFESATQFARMEGHRKVSLGEIDAATSTSVDVKAIAKQNFLDMETRIPLGRAVMLTGPGWEGRLDLHGPSYTHFKSYADAKAEEANRVLSDEDG